MKTILIELERGIIRPIAIPKGVEVIILDHDTNGSMIEKSIYSGNGNEVVNEFFGNGENFTEEEIKKVNSL